MIIYHMTSISVQYLADIVSLNKTSYLFVYYNVWINVIFQGEEGHRVHFGVSHAWPASAVGDR